MSMMTKWGAVAAAAIAGATAISQLAFGRFRFEGPAYRVASRSGAVELRQYAPRLVAETTVAGPFESTVNEGFRRLAAFIFGKNTGGAEVAMSTPVEARRPARVGMTVPVDVREDGGWVVSFTMPRRFKRDTLPTPDDRRIRIREEPGEPRAALRFRGRATEARERAKEAELRAWLDREGLQPAGPPVLAQYDPPWTLPFLRRNEVLLPIAPGR